MIFSGELVIVSVLVAERVHFFFLLRIRERNLYTYFFVLP